ncbi:SagB/ThcOx family dehydrogenase [Thermodesulfobacteriota bacterium]
MIKTASQYHQHTSYERGKIAGHYLDWRNQPDVYKEYPGITPVLLPENTPSLMGKLSSVLKDADTDDSVRTMGIKDLSLILLLTCSITAKARYSGEDIYYRSPASAGALYPTEIYVATQGVEGLDDELYHFEVHRHSLSPLRKADLSGYVAGLTIPHLKTAPTITFFFTAIFFRSAWKYRDRSYRYHLLDTGHVIENLVLAMKALGLPLNLSYDFDDSRTDHLLGLDESKEVSLAMAHVPGADPISVSKGQDIDELSGDIRKRSIVSGSEVDYPAIGEIHREGKAVVSQEKCGPDILNSLGVTTETWRGMPDTSFWPGQIDYSECIFKRRSSRNFVKKPMIKEAFFTLLDLLCLNNRNDLKSCSVYGESLCAGFFAGDIESLVPGLYILDNVRRRFGLVTSGPFMDSVARVCLDQSWLGNAAVHFLFLSNLDLLDRTWGARGYRYAMLNAGRMGERIYIGATSMGLGCCGIGAFYDGEAAELIGLNKDSRLLYLVAVGPIKSFPKRSIVD